MGSYNRKEIRIDPSEFQHPADKAASEAVRVSKAFQSALQLISKYSIEKYLRGINMSTYIQITEHMSPVLYTMLRKAMDMFEEPKLPMLYLCRTYDLETSLAGIQTPYIQVSSEQLRVMDEQMLWGWAAGRIAGIKNGFCEIKLVETVCSYSDGLIPGVILDALKLLLANWYKYAQLSLDRAELIATGDFNAVMRNILIGEVPMEVLKQMDFTSPQCPYLLQCRQFAGNEGKIMKLFRDTNAVLKRDAYCATRYLELLKFYQTDYYDILDEYE